MPQPLSYPGLYIEEAAGGPRSIVAAPTSIAVFVGYTHPFKTAEFGVPVSIFSFADYERAFGGFYQGEVPASVPLAVQQFFLNGGSDAYVVGLEAKYQMPSPAPAEPIAPAEETVATTGGGIVFTAREPTDTADTAITVNILNIRPATAGGPLDHFDLVVTYGTRVETFRGLSLTAASLDAIDSALVMVAPDAAGYGTVFPAGAPISLPLQALPPAGLVGTFSAADFAAVFRADGPLDKVAAFNLLLAPGVADSGVLSALLAFAERKLAFAILDAPAGLGADPGPAPDIEDVFNGGTIPRSQNGAIYFPYLKSTHPLTGRREDMPPSGFVAGIYARTDSRRGVWKAPAGLETIVNNTTGVVENGRMTDMRHGKINLAGVNCLRTFTDGTVVFGARTLVSANPAFQQYRYVPVRRLTLFIEQTLNANLKWIVFEPNDEPLWIAIRASIENFLLSLYNQGALQGTTPSQAFQVICDRSTTRADDIANGIVNIAIGFAPVKPAEFVRITISHLAGQSPA